MKSSQLEGLKSLGYFAVFLGVLFFLILAGNPLVIVQSGFVGVKRTLGKIDPVPLREGLHLRIPLLQTVEKIEIRTRAVEFTKEKQNPISSLSKDGLPVSMDVAILYRVDANKAPELIREYGPDYEEKIIKQVVRTAVRDAIAEMESSVVYQERQKLQEKIKREVSEQLTRRYLILEDVLIRDIRLPESVVRAIEEKRKAYEEAQRMQFLLEKEKLEAERKKVEAQGIAEANRIIAGSLTREYLMWKFIENIQEYARSQNNTIILLPYDTRMTPIINVPQGGQR
ncbi:prohibitin family protein [Hydrogenobacter sp. T-2]|uniref:prohibitin family protein n=1 Tax=Pampinifervens diazotrophicum TaxID=1632018 RepID=UPI002B25BE5A|nr:prohibitin family protein [Hydrogenobacter sp. T-2]WPM32190.1 prohibitin family protein [Hydrogenobacter sp. T-2]